MFVLRGMLCYRWIVSIIVEMGEIRKRRKRKKRKKIKKPPNYSPSIDGHIQTQISRITPLLLLRTFSFPAYFESNLRSSCHRALYLYAAKKVEFKRNWRRHNAPIVPPTVVMKTLDRQQGFTYSKVPTSHQVQRGSERSLNLYSLPGRSRQKPGIKARNRHHSTSPFSSALRLACRKKLVVYGYAPWL